MPSSRPGSLDFGDTLSCFAIPEILVRKIFKRFSYKKFYSLLIQYLIYRILFINLYWYGETIVKTMKKSKFQQKTESSSLGSFKLILKLINFSERIKKV